MPSKAKTSRRKSLIHKIYTLFMFGNNGFCYEIQWNLVLNNFEINFTDRKNLFVIEIEDC